MISELDRYQGIVLRQILVAHGKKLHLGIADLAGRVDTFSVGKAAFQIKHSSKRMQPWQFTYAPENLAELYNLEITHDPVWMFFVCGIDGVVGVSLRELLSIVDTTPGGTATVRVSRNRNSMYRVSGLSGELPRAVPRGVQPFLDALTVRAGDGR